MQCIEHSVTYRINHGLLLCLFWGWDKTINTTPWLAQVIQYIHIQWIVLHSVVSCGNYTLGRLFLDIFLPVSMQGGFKEEKSLPPIIGYNQWWMK